MKAFKIILTAFRADRDLLTNMQANHELYLEAKSIGLIHCWDGVGSFQEEGQDKPSQEICMCFETDSNFEARQLIQTACLRFGQDCCLLVAMHDSFLVSVDAEGYLPHHSIGKFQQVSKEEAKAAVAYTWHNGEYYLCK